MYGPDLKTTTKIAAGVILHDGAKAIIKRWVATDVTTNAEVRQEMKDFFLQHGVNSVAMSEGNMGCPHEEGEDFPHGGDCPFSFLERKAGEPGQLTMIDCDADGIDLAYIHRISFGEIARDSLAGTLNFEQDGTPREACRSRPTPQSLSRSRRAEQLSLRR
jgi:hypothetical protein